MLRPPSYRQGHSKCDGSLAEVQNEPEAAQIWESCIYTAEAGCAYPSVPAASRRGMPQPGPLFSEFKMPRGYAVRHHACRTSFRKLPAEMLGSDAVCLLGPGIRHAVTRELARVTQEYSGGA